LEQPFAMMKLSPNCSLHYQEQFEIIEIAKGPGFLLCLVVGLGIMPSNTKLDFTGL
jgi:hypothetical protein